MFSQADSATYYVSRLGWDSFQESYSYAPRLSTNKDVQRLVYLKDSSKVKLLMKSLKNSFQTVAAHIVLTGIFEPTDLLTIP